MILTFAKNILGRNCTKLAWSRFVAKLKLFETPSRVECVLQWTFSANAVFVPFVFLSTLLRAVIMDKLIIVDYFENNMLLSLSRSVPVAVAKKPNRISQTHQRKRIRINKQWYTPTVQVLSPHKLWLHQNDDFSHWNKLGNTPNSNNNKFEHIKHLKMSKYVANLHVKIHFITCFILSYNSIAFVYSIILFYFIPHLCR